MKPTVLLTAAALCFVVAVAIGAVYVLGASFIVAIKLLGVLKW
jgi:hypothetical protein